MLIKKNIRSEATIYMDILLLLQVPNTKNGCDL